MTRFNAAQWLLTIAGVIALTSCSSSGSDSSTTGSNYLTTTYDANGYFHLTDAQSAYSGYKPDSYNVNSPTTLFVWLHGCGGTADGELPTIAPAATRATQNYIAISIGGRDGACWDVNSDTPKVLAAITDVERYFNINPHRVILGGYSSGGDLAFRVGFQNAAMFAGLLVENSDPFRDTGATQASLLASASWKINIGLLAHNSDATDPIATIHASVATLTSNGFPVSEIDKAGTHFDADTQTSGTNYDLIHFLLPLINSGWTAP